jgi:hypothetical protein
MRNTRKCRYALVVGMVLVAPEAVAQSASNPEHAAVTAVVQKLFDAMARRDTVVLRALMLPGSELISFAITDTSSNMRRQSDSAFVSSLGRGKGVLLERFWSPTVLIRGPIATVWTPYDFHVDGKFSHCGVDSFTLVRGTAGWVVSGISYTVERSKCEPSPLGPPK